MIGRNASFNAAVEKSKGRVVVLVHPFFPENFVIGVKEYKQRVEKLVKKAKAPVVFSKNGITFEKLETY